MTMPRTTSFWQVSRSPRPDLTPVPDHADVVIVGGGIAGVSVATWLGRLAPERRVVLLEAERLAHGASGRNAGFLLQGTDSDYAATVDRLGRETARLGWQLAEETRDGLFEALDGTDAEPVASGNWIVALSAEEDERLRRSEALLREDGIPAAYHGSVEDVLGCRGLRGALMLPRGGMVNPVRVVETLASRSGATVCEATPVLRIEPEGDRVRVVSSRGAVIAYNVIVTANAYLGHLVPGVPVRPVRAQMLATEPVARLLDRPVYVDDGYVYLRQQPDGTVLIGGMRHRHVETEVGYEDATSEPLQRDLERFLREHFPALSAPVVRRWSGTMGFSPDGLPTLGELPDVPGALWLGGFTGHGMGTAFRSARTAVARLLGEPDEYAELLDAGRFKAV